MDIVVVEITEKEPEEVVAIIDSGGTASITNSNNTYNEVISSGITFVLPNVNNIDSNGTIVPTPAMTPFVCSPPITLGSDIKNSDNSFSHHLNDGDNYTLPDITIKNTNNTYNTSIPSVKNFEIPDTNIKNSDSSFDTYYSSCVTLNLLDISINNTNNSYIKLYPAAKNFIIPNTTVKNSDGSFDVNHPSCTTLNLPDITFKDSDGTITNVPACKDITAKQGGGWIRPSDWLQIDNLVNVSDNKFVGLYAVFPAGHYYESGNTISVHCLENYTVDWGDGTVTNYAAYSVATHTYDYNSIPAATTTSDGFRQVIVKITPNGGTFSTRLYTCYYNIFANWLDIIMSIPNLNAYALTLSDATCVLLSKFTIIGTTKPGFALININYVPIRQFEIPYKNINSLSYLLYCNAGIDELSDIITDATTINYVSTYSHIRKVGNIEALSCTNAAYAFNSCLVEEFGDIDIRNAPTTVGLLQSASLLRKIGVLNISSSESLSFAFTNSYSLSGEVNIISTSALQTLSYAFYGCLRISSIIISDASGVTDLVGTFDSCISLFKLRLHGIKTSFSISNCRLNASALDILFGDLADLTGFPAQTITITGNSGVAGCTPNIATSKNWIVAI